MLPVTIMFKLKVNIKAVPYLSLVLNTNLGVSPRPGSHTSAARYRAAAHSLSSTGLLYCVLHIHVYIYITLPEVHTNRKRFQCERPIEKRAVLREREEALGSPVIKVDPVEGWSWFQSAVPMIAKDCVWAICRSTRKYKNMISERVQRCGHSLKMSILSTQPVKMIICASLTFVAILHAH